MGEKQMMKTVLLLAVTLSAAWAMSEADLDKMNYTVTKDHFLPGEFMVADAEASNHTGLGSGPSNCPQGDIDCERSSGAGSYCKYWQSPSVCMGSDLPCTCTPTTSATRSASGRWGLLPTASTGSPARA